MLLRASVDLLEISTGILAEGCLDSDDRLQFLMEKVEETGVESVLLVMGMSARGSVILGIITN